VESTEHARVVIRAILKDEDKTQQIRSWTSVSVFPLRKFYTEQTFVLLRTKRMQLRNRADTNSKAFPTLKGLYDIYICRIKFRILEVRENEIALRKLSDGIAQLRTLNGTLVGMLMDCLITDPRQWTPADVKTWARWIAQEFSIPSLDESNFAIHGSVLCGLRKEDFLRLCPPFVGEILWEHLDRLQNGKILDLRVCCAIPEIPCFEERAVL